MCHCFPGLGLATAGEHYVSFGCSGAECYCMVYSITFKIVIPNNTVSIGSLLP